MSGDERSRSDDAREVVDSLPGLARIAATAWWHTAEWTAQNSVKTGRRLFGVLVRPETAFDLASDIRSAARGYARDLIGIEEIAGRMAPKHDAPAPVAHADGPEAMNTAEFQSLSVRGQQLLRLSSDVRYEEPIHPAFERILSELAPDEGRVLRLLLLSGPQPTVDVRSGGPTGTFNSRLIAQGLSMIGPRAGCRYVERVPSYLTNLNRLGLISFSKEMLRDAHLYQVVEAQPDVLDAMHTVRAAKLKRRSIHLTPLGEDFCRVCMTLPHDDPSSFPAHRAPDGSEGHPPPVNAAARP